MLVYESTESRPRRQGPPPGTGGAPRRPHMPRLPQLLTELSVVPNHVREKRIFGVVSYQTLGGHDSRKFAGKAPRRWPSRGWRSSASISGSSVALGAEHC